MPWMEWMGPASAPVQERKFEVEERDLALIHTAANAFCGFVMGDVSHMQRCTEAIEKTGGPKQLQNAIERVWRSASGSQ